MLAFRVPALLSGRVRFGRRRAHLVFEPMSFRFNSLQRGSRRCALSAITIAIRQHIITKNKFLLLLSGP